MSLTTIGFEARDRHRNTKAGLCKQCAENIDTSNLEKVKRTLYRDVYCINCYTRLGGSTKKKPDNINEKLCILLDFIIDDCYPMIGLAPGEQPNEENLAPGVTKKSHPEDATEQVIIETQPESETKQKIIEILTELSSKGNTRFKEKKLADNVKQIIAICS